MSENFSLNSFCVENRDRNEILQSLCKEFSEENDYHIKTKILYSLVQTYLLHFKEQLEENIKTTEFLELLDQIPFLCSKFLQTSASELCSLNEIASSNNFENKSKNVESASICFDVMLSCLEAFHVTEQCMAIVKISLKILSQGYTHCKESEMIYGDLLENFADQLGSFFKKIENLQMVVLQELDKLNVTKHHGNDPLINYIVLEMGNLCQVVFSLDADVAVELWPTYKRFITNHTSLKQISNINSVCSYLASKNIEILQLIQYSLDKNSEEDEELANKLVFYVDALATMMHVNHDSFKENVSKFRTFLLNLLHCVVSCYSPFTSDKTCMDIIKTALGKNTFVLLSHFYADENFLKSFLLTPPDKLCHVSNLLLKLCALQFMESSSLQLKKDFFKDIFSDFLTGNTEDDMKILYISIPRSTVTKTDTVELVTLYQFAYEQITEFSKLLPDSVIEELEIPILGNLESSSDVVYLLISDVWMYRLRCCSIEFLENQCYCVLQNLNMKNVKNIKIENFIKRMLKFVPTSHKNKLLEQFSKLKFICDDENIQHRYSIPDNTSTDNEICIHSEEQIKKMMNKLSESCVYDSLQLVQKACTGLELCVLFLHAASSSETLMFIEFASELFRTDLYEIQMIVLTLIKTLSRKSLPEQSQEFGKLVTFLAQLFSEAMHSKNYIVRYEARNVFQYFAQCTPHTKIVQETVRRDPSLKPIMKSYINTLPENNFLSEKEKVSYLKKQASESNAVKYEIPRKVVESLQKIFSQGNFQLLTE